MLGTQGRSGLALALLAATFLTPPVPARAAPGDTLGGEFRVNSFTGDQQRTSAVAMDADGDFVVAWESYGQDGSYNGIFAQRFDAAGVEQGSEFLVNSETGNEQGRPAVAMDADGNFVVVWESRFQDDDGFGIFAQRFDAAGVAQGPEFQVNSFATGSQFDPTVAMDADGDFVVAWDGVGPGDSFGIFAQRFDAAGAAQGSEFQVNSFTTDIQWLPALAMNVDGAFVVAWQSYGQDGNYSGVYAQRYSADGVPQGPEFQVGAGGLPAVAMDADGDFVVAWESTGQDDPDDPFGLGIFARRYDAAGAAQGPEFQVNTFIAADQQEPTVAMDADGDLVVAWRSDDQDGSGYGIFAQRFDSAGVAQGREFQVNTFTTGQQWQPRVAMDADGDFVVTWASYFQDGSPMSVFAQRFDGAERVEGDFDGDGNADVLWRNAATGNTVIWLMEGTGRRAGQSVGTPPLAWQVAGTGDFNGDGKADILWRHTGNGSAVIWQMDGFTKADSASIGNPSRAWVVEQLRDTDGDGNTDIFWRNTTSGSTVVWRMNGFTRTMVGSPGGVGPPWQVQ